MFKIRQGDIVQVVKGKDLGKKGKVLRVIPKQATAIVEGVNLVKKHRRQTRQDQTGGIISIEAPIKLCNIMILCKQCSRPVRTGFKTLADGTKSRFCKACKATI